MRAMLSQIPQLLCVSIACPFCVLPWSSCAWGVSSVFSVRSYCTAFRDIPHALCRVARDRPLHTLEYVKLFKSHVIRHSQGFKRFNRRNGMNFVMRGNLITAVCLAYVLVVRVRVEGVLTSPSFGIPYYSKFTGVCLPFSETFFKFFSQEKRDLQHDWLKSWLV